jgi:NTP pyrophosphatase (non-canonical NTP hydrolase)
MTNPTYQTRVAEFVRAHQLETSVEVRLLDLSSEVGELAKEVLKASQYGRTTFAPNAAWAGELADVFFALVCLANSTQVNLEEALGGALEKYQARLAVKGEVGSGK